MTEQIQKITSSTVTLGGKSLPSYAWSIEVGTYGAIGHATIYCSIAALSEAGVDVPNLTSGSAKTSVSIELNGNQMFGGNYTHGWFHFHEDRAEFVARDLSAVLADTKRSLADLNYQNQTVSQLVQQICQLYGLQADISITNDPLVGAIVDGDGAANSSVVMASRPQTLWNLVVFLARMTGANVWTEPDGTLIFHDASQDEGSNTFTWYGMPDPVTGASPGINPILELDILHQPERNKNFTVKVISHDSRKVQTVQQTVDVDGELVPLDLQSSVTGGSFTGSAGGGGGGVLGATGKPEYIYIIDGLTPDDAQKRAEGIAQEIAKRLLVVNATVVGDATIKPRQSFLINEGKPGTLLGFKSLPLFVSTVTHDLHTPQGGSIDSQGYKSTVCCLNVPNVGG